MKELNDAGSAIVGELPPSDEGKPRFSEHHKTITMATIARAAGVSQGARGTSHARLRSLACSTPVDETAAAAGCAVR